MEIKSDSLILGLLMSCALPLLLIGLITIAISVTRKRLTEVEKTWKGPRTGAYKYLIGNKWTLLVSGMVSGLLILFIVTFAAFFLISYKDLIPNRVAVWMFVSSICVLFLCGSVAGILSLLFVHKINSPKK